MKARRFSSLAVGAILVLAIVVACGPTSTQSPVAPSAAIPPTAVPATEVAPTAAPPAAEQPVYGGTVRVAYPSDIPSLDPPVSWDMDSWAAQLMVYSALYRFKYGSSDIEPDLAADMPEVSADGSTWTIPLRQGLKFSNGDPLTAKDVKYTWDRMLAKETQGWAVTYYMAVQGAAEAFSGQATGVDGVKVIDDQTIQFVLAEPIAYFGKLLAMPWTAVMNQAHVQAAGENIAKDPLGSGPYVLSEYKTAEQIVFDKNPNYFRTDQPYADHVIFVLNTDASVAALKLEKGEIDIYSERLPAGDFQRLKGDTAFKGQTFEIPWLDTMFITINSIQDGLKDVRVRQAMAYALNREHIIRAGFSGFGTPANAVVPPGDKLAHNASQPIYEYNPDKAKQLLAEAGYADGFTFDAASANYGPWDKFAQAVQADLEQVGIHMNLTLLEQSAWYESNAQEHNGITFMHWPYEIPDPAYIFDGGFSKAAMYPDSCCNFSWYTTPELEDMLKAARIERDPAKRGQLYQALDKYLDYDLALWIPLFNPIETYVISENLGNFQPPVVMHPRMMEPWFWWSKSGQ